MVKTSFFCALALAAFSTNGLGKPAKKSSDFYQLEATSIRGEAMPFEKLKGQAVLIVNTASRCGYTSQYEGLEKLHKTYGKTGLKVIGFPSNDFGGQEPGSEEEIAKFCKRNYGVTFALSKKVKTKGAGQSPIYRYLTTNAADKSPISWNFEKFLVNRNGEVVERFKSSVKPESKQMKHAIEKVLATDSKS